MTGLKEATIKARTSGSAGILNRAIATIQEAPFPVKLAVGSLVGGGTIAILSGCSAQSKPCEITANELTDKKVGACPLTTFHYDNPGNVLSADDQAKLRVEYGADISDVYLWYAVNKGSSTESDGDGMVAFSTYYFKNGRSMVVFPSANEDYYSGQAEKHEFISSMFESDEGKIIQSYNYPDKLNPGKVLSFLTIEYQKPDGATLEDISKDPSKLGFPERAIFSNPPANEVITYNVDSKNPDDLKLIQSLASIFGPGTGVVHALGEGTATIEAPTAIPTPVLDPIKIGTESIQPTTIVGYEAFGPKGELLATQDIYGNWIKVDREVAIPMATAEDWTNVNARLGTDFVINADGVIPGVDGVTVNKENGEVTFSFNGKGPERYSIVNVKVQEINGVKRLLVAGYAWNGESKSWEAFNQGFPVESPEAQNSWFIEADVPNGNWLRWHQRDIQDLAIKGGFVKPDGTADTEAYIKKLFTDENGSPAVRPTTWKITERISDRKFDFNLDGSKDYIHFGALWWESPKLEEAWQKGEKGFLKKEQFPGRAGLSFAYLADLDAVIISFDALNGDGSTTSLPTIIDVKRIWEQKTKDSLWATLAEGCGVPLEKIEEVMGKKKSGDLVYMIWPVTASYPDEEVIMWLSDENAQILTDPQSIDRREATINGNRIIPPASLDMWGAKIIPVASIQYWHE